MKKKWIAGLLTLAMVFSLGSLTAPALADSQRVVTLGADLSDAQKTSILKYFGILNDDGVQRLTITNQDERDHLASYIPLEQIGTRTFSCAYVCPTRSGGIRVKTANLSYVTSNMIATTLSTSGIVNCDVVAASPIKVSGTGALTGVIMAYEAASGEKLDPSRKELAAQELTTTEKIADEIGQVQATNIVNDIKIQIIENEIDDDELAEMVVDDILAEQQDEMDQQIALSQEEHDMLVDLAKQIAEQKYDYEDMKATLERVEENVKNLESGDTIINNDNSVTNVDNSDNSVTNVDNSVTNVDNSDNSITVIDISGSEEEERGDSILDSVDDSALGEDVISDSTNREDNLPTEEAVEVVALDTPEEEEDLGIPDAEFEEFGGNEEENADEAEPVMEEEPAQAVEEANDEEEFADDEMEVIPEAVEDDDDEMEVIPEAVEDAEEMEVIPEAVEDDDDEMEVIPEAVEDDDEMKEIPEEAEEAQVQSVEAYFSSNESMDGLVKINIAKDDVTPVGGTVTVLVDGESEVSVDLTDVSRWSANPVDEEVLASKQWSEGTVLTVVTSQGSESDFTAPRTLQADLVVQDLDGQQYAVQTAVDLPTSPCGVMVGLGGSQELLSGGSVKVGLYNQDLEGTAQITVNDSMVATADRESVSFAEGENSFTLSFLEEGVASVTVTFFDASGAELGHSVITLPVEAEH